MTSPAALYTPPLTTIVVEVLAGASLMLPKVKNVINNCGFYIGNFCQNHQSANHKCSHQCFVLYSSCRYYNSFCLLHVLFLLSSALFMIGTCSAFFVIIADLAPVVFAWVTSVPPDVPYLRILILFSLAVSIIFPLSLLRQLDSLSSLSTASLGFYAWLTIQVRCY